MHRAADRLAATQHVQRAIRAKDGGDSWHLFLDKLSFERDGAEGDAGEAARTRALQDVCAIYQKQRPGALARACAARLRWLDALARQLGPGRLRRIPLVSDSRLLLHLGRASVLENVGLYCDRTTGLPLIPGTALKGVLSTWACWEDNEPGLAEDPPRLDPHRRELARRILGDNSRDGSEHAGEVIFLGAFPAEPARLPSLELDIVTPHPDEGRGRILPNVFLAFSSGTVWEFVIFSRHARHADAVIDQAMHSLVNALCSFGLGAKTAAGYGSFRTPTSSEAERYSSAATERDAAIRREREQMETAARLRDLTPDERAYEEYLLRQKDWIAAARDIASKAELERGWILRYFRSPAGAAILKNWTNDKGRKRIETLKQAGL